MLAFAPFDAVVGAAHTTVDALSVLLTPFAGGLAGAVAIVVFTIGVRLLISPLTYLQVRGERRRAALTEGIAPQLAELRDKHRDDPQRLVTETFAAQREAGISPLPGCLPMLVQAPFFMVMYRLVTVSAGTPDGVLAGQVFGVPLTAHLGAGPVVFGVLLALAAAVARWMSRRAQKAAAVAAAGAPAAASAGAVGRLVTLMPYATVLMVAIMPLAAGLYLVTSSAWTALEHAVWRRPVSDKAAL
jgi:YidC/Oxa1 family membrane protein insertase